MAVATDEEGVSKMTTITMTMKRNDDTASSICVRIS